MKDLCLLLLITMALTFSCKQAAELEEADVDTLPGAVISKNGSPIITNLLPSGILPNSTGSVTLQVQTDEQTICKYSENNVSFYGMNDSLSSNDGLTHSKELSISEVKAYTYYVSCEDLDGGLSLGSNKIEFSIDINTVDLIAPNVFNAGPTSTLPDGTTQINIYATTSENAVCRYSNDPSDEWSEMNLMSGTGSNIHGQLITGLADGNNYSYYFICEDPSGNRSDKRGITFSVSTFILQDGVTLYSNNCAYCHGDLPFSEYMGASPQEIQNAINSVGSMRAFESLRPEEVQNLSEAMQE